MNRLVISLLVATLVALGFETRGDAQLPAKVKDDTQKVVDDNNAFAFDLYGKLRTEKGNLFLSPYSISTALAMTYAGARGQTATEMATTLHFTLPQERLHLGFADLLAELNNRGKPRKAELQIANRLWGQKDYGFLPAFLKLTEYHYRAGLKEVDFAGDPERVRKEINAWVEEQTKQKIKELLQPGIIKGTTRLVLTNAIYFKAAWRQSFHLQDTRDERFEDGSDVKRTAKMMNAKLPANFKDFGDLKVLELPYADHEMSMIVLLPKQINGLAALEKQLTAAKLKQWLAELSAHEVQVTLPKFKVTAEFLLNDPLKALGMVSAFGAADFSGMNSGGGLCITAVVHKAFVDVNEAGTEAAAATAVVLGKNESKDPVLPAATFRADHPFLYLIRDNRTGSILFMGRVVNP